MAADLLFSRRFSRVARRLNSYIQSSCALCDGSAPWGRLCAGCSADMRYSMRHHRWRCTRCALALPAEIPCPDCASGSRPLEKVVAAFDYVPPADSLVLRYKNAKQFQLATVFAHLACEAIIEHSPEWPVPFWQCHAPLIPVPGSPASLRRRGFNPAAEFASQLGRLLHLPVMHSLLHREPERFKQSSLNREQRQANTAHLYYCSRNVSLPCAVLVDDVLTTGSTLDAAARALIAAGAHRLIAVVIARTPYRHRNTADATAFPVDPVCWKT